MRKVFLTVLLGGAALACISSCGDGDSGKVTWTCACASVCDGAENTTSETICASPDQASQAVEGGADACVATLTSCTEASCRCVCEPTGSSCG